jgi:hypothetical protein
LIGVLLFVFLKSGRHTFVIVLTWTKKSSISYSRTHDSSY